MKAFTNTTMTKDEMIAALKWHQEQDNFVKGRYFEDGKGCAVGCSLESIARLKNIKLNYGDHEAFERHLGIPEWLAFVEDRIFEEVTTARSKTWPLEFIEAINIGSDLNQVKAPFMMYVLRSALKNFDHHKYPDVAKVINDCIELYEKYPEGPSSGNDEWSAVLSAASAAESAAAYAVWSAVRSVDTATESAWAEAYEQFADELLRLMRECK